MKPKIVCIVGLGYVGLPLAEAFSKHLKVIGFDIDEEKKTQRRRGAEEERMKNTCEKKIP